jgi:hypothetical protein
MSHRGGYFLTGVFREGRATHVMEDRLALASEARGFIRHQSTALHKAMSVLILNA